jgi:TetR/AcrR family transcriptional regulator of autoinduction and epiphytic fitness
VKKPIDGRTTRGLRVRAEVRESILAGYVDLIRSGVPAPTARETAEQAGLSLRAIFNHFSDLRALRLASFNRMQAQSSEFFSQEIPDRGSAAERLELFVQKQAQRLEYVTPFHRTAAMVESVDPDVAEAMQKARNAARRDLEKTLGPALKPFSRNEKRELLTALHMICAWPSWETLRAHYHLSPKRARAIITGVALTVLSAAERHVHASKTASVSCSASGRGTAVACPADRCRGRIVPGH